VRGRAARRSRNPVRPERGARTVRPKPGAPLAEPGLLDRVKLDERGLVPVIAQEEDGTVLMLAWANREALEATLRTRRGTYWSRSRRELWRKGDTSGHVQEVLAIKVDCDGDAVLYVVRQTGPACHLGSRSCFS
jgi:phosphoribosyl-AMP cyclohydrolase